MVLVKKERESNFELLRLIAMIFIVLYHFCSSVKAGIDTENRWILLGYTIFHIGVPVFILISGYWTIKLSIRKLISFYLYCFLWYLMCYGISVLFLGEEFILKDFMMQWFPFSHTGGRWFITYYFRLMLLAPVLNLVENMSLKEHCAIVLINLFAIIWWGLVWQSDVVNGGKSIVYFVGLYLTGNLLRRLNDFNMNLPYLATLKENFTAYILIVFIISVGTFLVPVSFSRAYRGVFFAYQGPGLILQCVVLILLFSKIKIKKKWINFLASSSFSIYLFHENQYTSMIYHHYVREIYTCFNGLQVPVLFLLLCMSICVISIALDKIVRIPLQNILESKCSNLIDRSLTFMWSLIDKRR